MAKLIQSIFENKIQVHNTLVHMNKTALGYDMNKVNFTWIRLKKSVDLKKENDPYQGNVK